MLKKKLLDPTFNLEDSFKVEKKKNEKTINKFYIF